MKLNRYLSNLDSLIAAIIGYYAIYLFTNYSGVGLSPDSIMYASTATQYAGAWPIMTFNTNAIGFSSRFFTLSF